MKMHRSMDSHSKGLKNKVDKTFWLKTTIYVGKGLMIIDSSANKVDSEWKSKNCLLCRHYVTPINLDHQGNNKR